ncbi:MAG: AraC family transcriptional regulator [Alphaproteobacteria bacterium]
MASAQLSKAQEQPILFNLTRSIQLLEQSKTRRDDPSAVSQPNAAQPYCAGDGIRTDFPVATGDPFKPFDETYSSEAFTDIVKLEDDFYMRVVNDPLERDCLIIAPGEDWVKITFSLVGKLRRDFGDDHAFEYNQGYAGLYYHPPGVEKLEGGEGVCWGTSVTLYLTRPRLLAAMGDMVDQLPAHVLMMLKHGDDALMWEALPISNAMIRAVVDIANTPFVGQLRHTFVQAKGVELLCDAIFLLCHHDETEVAEMRLSARDKRQLEMARDVLLENYVAAPTIAVLARQVGVNQRKLKVGFKYLFGVTIFDFVQGLRMEKAWELLNSGDYCISQVADMVGYAHARNFTTAFKRHFGVSPKVARNSQLKNDNTAASLRDIRLVPMPSQQLAAAE